MAERDRSQGAGAEATNPENHKHTRRGFMRRAGLGAALAAAASVSGGAVAPRAARAADETPIGDPWWPSRWGAGDQAGASNWMTPEKTREAVKLIKDGKVYRIGRDYEAGMPLFGPRAFALRVPGGPSGGPFGANQLVYNDEFLATEVGQVGTQFDGLGHIGAVVGEKGTLDGHRYYNGFTGAEVYGSNGLKKLGIEHLNPLFTRGHLIDIAALKGQMLDAGQEITIDDMLAALSRQGGKPGNIQKGDGVFFHTGWGSLWMKDNARFNSGAPGIGLDLARFLAVKEVAIVGADTWPVEVVPDPEGQTAFAVHNELITKNGIFLHENLDFEGLRADGKYEFAYIFAPTPIKGATGSMGSPIAVT